MSEASDERVKELLAFIEAEKKLPKPSKKQIRTWHYEIRRLKEDYRCVYTGQDARFLNHTSMREWED